MTAAEAHAAAASEGLALLRAENSLLRATGFKGVYRIGSASKPFHAQLTRGGRCKSLGNFATAEEAALAVARHLGPAGVVASLAAAATALEPAPMTAAEGIRGGGGGGAALLRAENATGFKGVYRTDSRMAPSRSRRS